MFRRVLSLSKEEKVNLMDESLQNVEKSIQQFIELLSTPLVMKKIERLFFGLSKNKVSINSCEESDLGKGKSILKD